MPPKRVLVLNTGSSSLKWSVLDAESEALVDSGSATWEGTEGGRHEQALLAALRDVPEVDAIGHRVVHGGARLTEAVLVDPAVRAAILELAELAPLHNAAAVAGIDAASQRFPDLPQVAAFDTAFHATLPEEAALYPVPWAWTEQWSVRRFGFHGLSVQYAVGRATELLGKHPGRLVVCHLGSGCSATAVAAGRSVETTMGFTPLEGLMMGRRSGSVDPGLLLYLLRRRGLDANALDAGLNEQAGLFGVSGLSADMRAVLAAAEAGQERAGLAVKMFVHRVVLAVGALSAALGGLEALVFTGGIGEHSAPIRAAIASGVFYLGLALDPEANTRVSGDADISASNSPARCLVIVAREDLTVLREVKRVLGETHGAAPR